MLILGAEGCLRPVSNGLKLTLQLSRIFDISARRPGMTASELLQNGTFGLLADRFCFGIEISICMG